MKMIVGNVYEPLRARILPCCAAHWLAASRRCGAVRPTAEPRSVRPTRTFWATVFRRAWLYG
eukprot:scaffold14540_cov35-Phaeocystis_antarctica.AAC.2